MKERLQLRYPNFSEPGDRLTRGVAWIGSLPSELADVWWRATKQEDESAGIERQGLVLYGFTLLLETAISSSCRWLLAYFGIGLIDGLIPLGQWAAAMPWLIAFVPLVWSLVAMARVGGGRGELHGREAVRLPTEDEHLYLLGAMAELWIVDWELPMPRHVRIIETPAPLAFVRYRTLFLGRALLRSAAFPAVLAHELSHLNSRDPWLRVALHRLGRDRIFFTRLRFDELRGPWKLAAVLCGPGRWFLRFASGGIGRMMLCGAWSRYWTAREFTADAYAVSLAQGPQLAAFLRAGLRDTGLMRLLEAVTYHPPAAERIERLRVAAQLAPVVDEFAWDPLDLPGTGAPSLTR